MNWFRFLLVAGLWLAGHCLAAPTLDASQLPPEGLSLTRHFEVVDDASAQLTLADVRSPAGAARFQASSASGEALGFSYTRSAVWLRLRLANPGDAPLVRLLEISYPLLAKLDAHVPDEAGQYRTMETGFARPFAARLHPSRFYVIPLTLPPRSEQTIYLRAETPNSLNVPARLWTPEAHANHERAGYVAQGLYFGLVLAITLYNLMLFLALRDWSYLLYVVFATSVAAALAAFTGIGVEYLWGDLPAWTARGVNIPSSLAGVALLLFTRRVLDTRQLLPRLDKALLVGVAVNLACIPLLLFFFQRFVPLFVVLNALTALLLLLVGVMGALQRHRSAYYFVAAFAVILLAVVLTHLRNLGLLPTNVLTSEGTQFGSAIEMLLLSFALADRYNAMRRDKARAQSALVESLRASEQMLESRVAARTAELEDLNRRLEAMSTTDGLTGIANRRQFDARLASEWTRALRLHQPLALALIDVDFFKKFNDRYGHQAGDDCLRRVARALAATLHREGDLVARYGGEEFVFIAPASDAAAALQMASRVSAAVRELAIPHADSPSGLLTLSIGVAACVPQAESLAATLLAAADQALYQAKAQGRDLVLLGTLPHSSP
ncbi:diguanylate cyclase [Pelomonas sp. V22]|uniref:diguanylate cyclase n=1 Tax=Pelomonas sp. V22 TaxID=2822139 RepID=UPI0024A8BDD1|nr:diguanylate cyclase [Pelomonas sp. V22]MDI4633867.1 diguanylate cyclase [Pelomonas sp. V22]